jgi:hypothetical protein
LDDTLYPLAPVIEEANQAFSKAMAKYGFPGILPQDINDMSMEIRQEMAKTDPEGAAVLTHTELRKLAIRKAMEQVMLQRKLQECAEDWATNVDSLGPAVVGSAKRYVRHTISACHRSFPFSTGTFYLTNFLNEKRIEIDQRFLDHLKVGREKQ